MVYCAGFTVYAVWCMVWGLWFRAHGLRFVMVYGFGVHGLWCVVDDVWFRVYGRWFRV